MFTPPTTHGPIERPKNPRDAETALQGKNGADECDFPKETIIQFMGLGQNLRSATQQILHLFAMTVQFLTSVAIPVSRTLPFRSANRNPQSGMPKTTVGYGHWYG